MGKLKLRQLATLLVATGFLSFTLVAAKSHFFTAEMAESRNKIIRIALTDYALQMQKLNQLGFDIAGVDIEKKIVDLVVSDEEIKELAKLDLKIVEVRPFEQTSAPDSSYLTAEEVSTKMQEFATNFPQITALRSIGKTGEGRDLWAIKISDNPATRETEEPTILFNAMHHAREVMTPEVAVDTIQMLLNGYGVDSKTTHWVNHNEIWVLPMLNPDGNNKVWTSSSMWRKNNRGGFGVDINRNYPYQWNFCSGSSGSEYSETYRGPSAASEPETQALMKLVSEIKPVFDISYHSYSELVLYPYGCDGQHTPNHDMVEGIGQEMANLLVRDSGSGRYTAGTPWETLYSVDGADIDWMYNQHQVIAYVIEVNGASQGFQPSYSEWRDKTVQRLRPAWGLLLDKLGSSGIRGQIKFNVQDSVAARVGGTEIFVQSTNDLNAAPSVRKLNPDGTFHFILKPGTYQVKVITPGQLPFIEDVLVEEKRVDLEFVF
jgi:carboxypeptidase T